MITFKARNDESARAPLPLSEARRRSTRLLWRFIGEVILVAVLLTVILASFIFVAPPWLFWLVVIVTVVVAAVHLMRRIHKLSARLGVICPGCGCDISRIHVRDTATRPDDPDLSVCENCGTVIIDPHK